MKVRKTNSMENNIRKNLNELTVSELQIMLRKMDLKVSGTKSQIIDRILKHVKNPHNPKDIPSCFLPKSSSNDLTIRQIRHLESLMDDRTGKKDSIQSRLNEYILEKLKGKSENSNPTVTVPVPITLLYGILLDIGWTAIQHYKLCQFPKIRTICNDEMFWKLLVRKDLADVNFYGKVPTGYQSWKQYYLKQKYSS